MDESLISRLWYLHETRIVVSWPENHAKYTITSPADIVSYKFSLFQGPKSVFNSPAFHILSSKMILNEVWVLLTATYRPSDMTDKKPRVSEGLVVYPI